MRKNQTLEKDKEDQIKYYLSCPKPPVLDMKWTNHDINVVEWANIQKFSTLDDIVTPLRLLELLFDNVLVDMIFGYSCTVIERKQALVLKLLKKNSLIFKHATA